MAPIPRKHERVAPSHIKVACKPGSLLKSILSRKSSDLSWVLDCSEEGMRVYSVEPFALGEKIQLSLQVSFIPGPIRLVGKVLRRRLKGTKGSVVYEVGLKIENPSWAYLEMLKRLRADPRLRKGRL